MNTPGWIAKKRTSVKGEGSMGKSGKANPKKMKDKGIKSLLDGKVDDKQVMPGKKGKING